VSVFAFAQLLAGGLLHVTPAHGLPLHLPSAQPDSQFSVEVAYEQTPPAQVPDAL
jgi:hypothetical protein